MRGSSTVVINGKVYDAVSGLAVAHPNPTQHSEAQAHTNAPVARKSPLKPSHHSTAQNTAKTKHNHATRSHSRTQRSTTLRRDVLKKPESKQHLVRRKPATGSIAKSPHVRRFAPHPARIDAIVPVKTVPATKQQTPQKEVLPVSPIVTQAHAKVAQHKANSQPAKMSSSVIKEHLIAQRLAEIDDSTMANKQAPRKKRKALTASRVLAVSLAFMVLGGYMTYLSMPGLSVRVAASQAGIAATYPDYKPTGYRFDGPVSYAPGQVSMKFTANAGSNVGYTINEQRSSWDSEAVYDNLVATSGKDYTANAQQGLTIYTYDNGKAAWVNNGILYTIEANAPLRTDQLLKIAGSL